MKQEVMEKWVAALESGEYKRGKGYLKTQQGRFCCLGVLCDLHQKETGQNNWYRESGLWYYNSSYCMFPENVMLWAGLQNESGSSRHSDYLYKARNAVYSSLAGINDDTRLSFKDIAEIIRKNWEKL